MLAFLHTAEVHVPNFTRVVRELDAGIPIRHAVRADLLASAIADGQVSAEILAETQQVIGGLVAEGARVVLCTCSTLGSAAESTASAARVLRVDRPMAERAVGLGRPVLVVATTPTAMTSAVALLQECARGSAVPAIRELSCAAAWERLQSGELHGYARAIAEQVETHARPGDVVVLAQASMAPAAALIRHEDVEVLTSPEVGVRAALELLRA